VSAVVQASPSSHDTVLGELTQPVAVSHESVVHTLPSLQLGAAPGMHEPPPQVSSTVQALPSLHGRVLGAFTQPLAGLQESVVQPLVSSQLGAGPGTQVPAPSQVSVVVQALPSLHERVCGMFTQPLAELQVSSVHWLPSLQSRGPPEMHEPALHMSLTVQALPSSQAIATLTCSQPVATSHESWVQTLPSLQLSAGPGMHEPALHVSVVVHALPSEQARVWFVLTQPLAGLQVSSVHWLPSLQSGAAPGTHEPAPSHTSSRVQALPSEQGRVWFVLTQPLAGLQVSSVH